MLVRRLAWTALAACLAAPPLVHAQKGKKPPPPPDIHGVAQLLPADGGRYVDDLDIPQDGPGTVDWDLDGTCQNAAPGGITGDGNPYFDDGTGTAAYLRSLDGDFVLEVRGTTRRVQLYFTDPVSTPTTPRKEYCAMALTDFHFHPHVLNIDGSDDINLGLLDIAPGATHPARILGNFDVEGLRYQYRFNNAHYPESTNIQITRGPFVDVNDPTRNLAGSNSWLIETGVDAVAAGDIVQLQSPALTKKGNPGPNDEGRYHFPLRIVFTADLPSQ